MRTVDRILKDWKNAVGTLKTGKNSQYVAIEFKERTTLLLMLAQTMLDEGHDENVVLSPSTQVKVVDCCTPSKEVPIPAKNIKKWKAIVTQEWDYARDKVVGTKISKYEEKKVVTEAPKPEKSIKNLELNPTDRIKVDTSEYVESEIDMDFLKEIGADLTIFGETE
jgi:hypothetical protein